MDYQTIDVAGIVRESITDGPGIRYTLFVQGCPHCCQGCQNQQTWEFGAGTKLTVDQIFEEILKNPLLSGVTFSGGEPFCQAKELIPLAEKIKEKGMELAIYTGYTAEELLEEADADRLRLLALADIVIDGRFELDKKSYELKFRGSSNQRTIDGRETARQGKVVLNTGDRWNQT